MSSFWYSVVAEGGLTETQMDAIRELPISEGEETTLGYLQSPNFPLAELLHDYVSLSAFEQSTLGARGLVLRVDKEIQALLDRPQLTSGVRMAILLLVRVRDRVVAELVGSSSSGDGEETATATKKGLVQSLPIPSDSVGWTSAHRVISSSSSSQLLPSWARAPEDQEAYLKWLENPSVPERLPLRAFYTERERKTKLVVNSEESSNTYLEGSRKDFSRFTVSLSPPLSNVTRLQLDEITFPSALETVTSVFGGNLVILEPRVKGLARHAEDAGFRVRLDIEPGHYATGAPEIVAKLNESLVKKVVPTSAMDWGDAPEKTFRYNETSQSVTMSLDLGMQFHQDAFELRWLNRSAAHFLGYNLNATVKSVYLPGALRSTRAIENSLDMQNLLNASTLKVTSGRATVRYVVVPSETEKKADFSVSSWLRDAQNVASNAKLTRVVQLLEAGTTHSFNSMVQSLRTALAKDDVFGKHSFVQEMLNDDGRRVLGLGLVPDAAHADLRTWWNRSENAGRTVLVVDFAPSDANVWTDPSAGCSFPVFAAKDGEGDDAFLRVVPSLVVADAAYESETPLTVPSGTVWGEVNNDTETTTVEISGVGAGGSKARVHLRRNEARLDGGTGQVVVLSGMYLRSTSDAFRKMDRFVRLEPGANYTATTLVAHAHEKLSAAPFLGNSVVRIEPGSRRVKFLVDVAYESKTFVPPPPEENGKKLLENTSSSKPAALAALPTGTEIVAKYLAAPDTTAITSTPGSSEIVVETAGDGGLPAGAVKYVLGKLELTLLPDADSMDTTGVRGLVLEDWTEHTSVSTLVARINDVIAGASYSDPEFSGHVFVAVLAGSKITLSHAYRDSKNTKTLYKLRLSLRATKVVTESLFELRLIDAALWRGLGFAVPDHPLGYSLSDQARFDLDAESGLARAAVLADFPLVGSDSVLRLTPATTATPNTEEVVARLCVRGRVSSAAGDGSPPFPAPAVRGLDAAEPAESAYELDLALPTGRDLSAGEIVTLFNERIVEAVADARRHGRFGPLLRWRDDQTARKVWLEALYAQRFDARDFNLVTYSPQLFSSCVARRGMVSAGYLFSLGYTLGFRDQIEYDLSQPDRVSFRDDRDGRPLVELTGGVCADTSARKFYLSVSDACTSRPGATVLRLTPPFLEDSGGSFSSANVLRSARAAAAASGVDCVNGLDDATSLGLQLDLTSRGGSASNALTQRQLYAAAVSIATETGRKRARAEIAGLGDGGYGSERFVLPKGQWPARMGDVSAGVVTGGSGGGLASNLSVQNDLMAVFVAPNKGTLSFLTSGGESSAVRYYAGPVKLSTLQITVTDMYGAPAPILNNWNLAFSAVYLPSSETAAQIGT